jgi:hypothetical protein
MLLRIVFAVVFAGYGATAVVVFRTYWGQISREDVEREIKSLSFTVLPWQRVILRYLGTPTRVLWSAIHGLCWPILLYRHIRNKFS